jgi:hypothetical protein
LSDYLQRDNLKALPEGQRQLISLVLLEAACFLELVRDCRGPGDNGQFDCLSETLDESCRRGRSLIDVLDEDYESLDEIGRRDAPTTWQVDEAQAHRRRRPRDCSDAVAQEIAELRQVSRR